MSMPATPTTSSFWWQREGGAARDGECHPFMSKRKLKLVVNRIKSKCATDRECVPRLLHQQPGIESNGRKSHARFKQRVKEITRRNRGHAVQAVIDELRRTPNGWMNYFGISHTYREVLELDDWIRRRVRLYYWKQWKRPRTRRRNLIKLGANPSEVHMASRSRKGLLAHEPQQHRATALSNRG
jgi:RNA-directed DNA polymerase